MSSDKLNDKMSSDSIKSADGSKPAETITNETRRSKEPDDGTSEVKLFVKKRFNITLNELRSQPETMLGKIFSSGMSKAGEDGEYEIHNIRPKILKGILDYYKNGLITIPGNIGFEEIDQACTSLEIPLTENTVQNWKYFLKIKSEYEKKIRVIKLYDTEIIPHIWRLSSKGISNANFGFFKEMDRANSDKVFVKNTNSFILFLDEYLFHILGDDYPHCLASQELATKHLAPIITVTFEIKQGNMNNSKFKYILCRCTW